MEKSLRESSKFKKQIIFSREFTRTNHLLINHKINTICHSGRCPNINECFAKKKLTFMILGDICSRHCGFCNVNKGQPCPVDPDEYKKIIDIVELFDLKYVVITSVTRDDLEDGGCSVYLKVIQELKKRFPELKIEVLIPDFKAESRYLEMIALSAVDVIGHNIETIERLYAAVRPIADFSKSLQVLSDLKKINPEKIIKTGFMVGLGEDIQELKQLLEQIKQKQVDVVTMGQYFQPSLKNHPVEKFYSDDEFNELYQYARDLGFRYICSGRFVRSSYYAEDVFKQIETSE